MKKNLSKNAPKKAASPVAKKAVVSKKTAPKPLPKKLPSSKQKISSSVGTPKTAQEGVKMLGILHLAGNILSGGILGVILVLGYLLLKKNITTLERETCYEIINFNISFWLYTVVLAISIVGLILIPLVILVWLILLISGFMTHLEGHNYRYRYIIRFVS